MSDHKTSVCSSTLLPPMCVARMSLSGEKQRAVAAEAELWCPRFNGFCASKLCTPFACQALETNSSAGGNVPALAQSGGEETSTKEENS